MVNNAISIEPYFDPEVPNMGFEKYGLSTAPGSEVTEYISQDINGRYLTGLDLDAQSVIYMEDKVEKAAVEQEINDVVALLERTHGKGALNAKNKDFWGDFSIKISFSGKSIDPNNPRDLLLYYAIKAGGFESIAPSLEAARSGFNDKSYKFYLRHVEKDADLKTERARTINKAKGILTQLDEEDNYRMLLVAKIVLAPNNEFSEKTPKSIIYEKLDQFIDGKIVKDNKRSTVRHFLEASKKPLQDLYMESLVRDALYFNFIIRESDGHFYNKQTEVRLGKTEKEVVKYLSNPVNQVEFENIKSRVESKFTK